MGRGEHTAFVERIHELIKLAGRLQLQHEPGGQPWIRPARTHTAGTNGLCTVVPHSCVSLTVSLSGTLMRAHPRVAAPAALYLTGGGDAGRRECEVQRDAGRHDHEEQWEEACLREGAEPPVKGGLARTVWCTVLAVDGVARIATTLCLAL